MTNKELEKKVNKQEDSLTKVVKEMTKAIDTLTKTMDKNERVPIAVQPIVPNETAPPTTTAPEQIATPIPEDYRHIVNTVLNRSFGIKIVPRSNEPRFDITIVVPEQYSILSADEKKEVGVDLRSKVLNYADGVNGLRQWTNLMYNNFSQEIKAKITADRMAPLT